MRDPRQNPQPDDILDGLTWADGRTTHALARVLAVYEPAHRVGETWVRFCVEGLARTFDWPAIAWQEAFAGSVVVARGQA